MVGFIPENSETNNNQFWHLYPNTTVVLVSNNNIYRYQTIFLPSVSIDIEISGHGCFSRETFQTISRDLVVSRNVNKYGISTLAVSESGQK